MCCENNTSGLMNSGSQMSLMPQNPDLRNRDGQTQDQNKKQLRKFDNNYKDSKNNDQGKTNGPKRLTFNDVDLEAYDVQLVLFNDEEQKAGNKRRLGRKPASHEHEGSSEGFGIGLCASGS